LPTQKKNLESLEREMDDMSRAAKGGTHQELERLRREVATLRRDFYDNMGPWQRTQLSRHPQRPNLLDYVRMLLTDFSELHGDRGFADDQAMICGMARFRGRPVMVVGQQKGRDTRERLARNFGQAKPEGYRKALRTMELSAKFGRPVFCFIDTTGAYAGVDAEERGQAEAIARSTETCLALGVPNVAVIVGEGGSGGAIAIATTNRVLMLEHAIYSVISPEGAASILWRDTAKAQDAATGMKITAQDMIRFGVIDQIVTEPIGGAHRDPAAAIASADSAILGAIEELRELDRDAVRRQRWDKFLAMGRTLG
jgi:acetyl-CoA carboxylase carboxyl transferase subunit alpha